MAGVRDNTVSNVVSGSIASFKSVGQVPLKSLKVNFSPIQEGDGDPSPSNIRAISGWTGCNLHIDKKNLFNVQIVKGAITTSNGEISIYTSGDRNRLVGFYVEIPAGTYTISCKENKQVNVYFYKEPNINGYIYSERLTTWEDMPKTFTTAEKRFVVFVFRNSDNSNLSPLDMTEVQLELGSNATAYEPYNGTTVPASWSDLGTVYGGYVDLISGEVWKTFWQYIFTGEETFNTNSSNSWVTTYIQPVDGYYPTAAQPYEGMCSHYPYGPYGAGKIGVMYNERTCTFDYRIHDAAGWKQYCTEQYIAGTPVQVAYKLKIPQLIGTIDPVTIKSLIGQNNIWSNADTVEVQYCALELLDIYKQRFKTNEPHLQSVSGNIASFQTDMVAPLKECKVYFEPIQASGTPSPDNVLPISGWNNLEVYRTSKNIRNWTITDTTIPSSYGNFNGFNNGYWDNYWIIPESLWGKTITYSVEIVRAENPTIEYAEARCWTYTSSGELVQLFVPPSSQRYYTGSGRSTLTFTIPENTGRLALAILAGIGDRIYNPIVSIGSTAIEYEPYNGSTTSITLPSTYYGGCVDLTSGEGETTYKYKKLVGNEDWMIQTSENPTSPYRASLRIEPSGQEPKSYKPIISDKLAQSTSWIPDIYAATINPNGRIIMGLPEELSTKEAVNNWIQSIGGIDIYWETDYPTSFTLTPTQLKTLKNQNNIWSNTNGITEVKYWTHGNIADKRKVVWNQWAPPLISDYWNDRNSTETITTFENGIATTQFILLSGSYHTMCTKNSSRTYQNHKYYSRLDCMLNKSVDYMGGDVANIAWSKPFIGNLNEWGTYSTIVTGEQDRNSNIYYPRMTRSGGLQQGTIAKTKNPFVIDLTQMFGEGNEPSTAAEFEALCVKNNIDLTQYHPYDEGTQMYWYF